MVMVSKFSNFPDELSENDELREYELSGSDCTYEALLMFWKSFLVNHGHFLTINSNSFTFNANFIYKERRL